MLMSSQLEEKELKLGQKESERNLVLFELNTGGHYAAYILHLVRYWRDCKLGGRLNVVVSPKFRQQHPDIIEVALGCDSKSINFVEITPKEDAALIPRKSPVHRARRALQDWRLLCKYARYLQATQCLIMYFDTSQTAAALGLKPPCPVSGIYFRPTFHYGNFPKNSLSRKEKVQQWREKIIVPRVLKNPYLKTLFCLDPFAVEYMQQNYPTKSKTVYLPDPVQVYDDQQSDLEKLKASLGIEPHRQVFLMFGLIDGRKGIHQLLAAISMLPKHLEEKLCLLLVGPKATDDQQDIEKAIAKISDSQSVQIISCDKYVPDQEIQPYLQISDTILAPYQRHVGMSSILVRTAVAGKPVLSSDYGLMGEMTRRYGLGLTVDSRSPKEIAEGITQFLTQQTNEFYNLEKMNLFAQGNSADKFATVIFQNM